MVRQNSVADMLLKSMSVSLWPRASGQYAITTAASAGALVLTALI